MIYFILILGTILRFININQSFWLDEASQALTAKRSLGEIVFNNNGDFQPPFSYILSHFWIQFGQSEIWLRLLPVLFGVGSIWVLYKLGTKLFNQKFGLLAAFLLAIAPYHIYYSQEFRMYSMVTFFSLVASYFFIKLLLESFNRTNLVLFIISSTLVLFTHYLGVMIIVAQILYLLFFDRKMLKKFLLPFFVIAILFTFWLPYFFSQLNSGVNADAYLPGWSQMLSLSFYKAIPLLATRFIIGRIDFDNSILYLSIIGVVLLIFGVSLVPILKRIKEKSVLLLICLAFFPIVLTFLLSFRLPMFQPFRLLFTLPYILLLICVGLGQYKRYQKVFSGVICCVMLIGLVWFNLNPKYWREDWKGAVLAANNFIQNEEYDRVIFAWPESFAPYRFYSARDLGVGAVKKMPANLENVDHVLLKENLGERIVYFSYLDQLSDPNQSIRQWIEAHNYKLIEVKDFNGVGFLYFYALRTQTIWMVN